MKVKNAKTLDELTSDSTNWGNYSNKELPITSSNAKQSTDKGATYTAITGTKPASSIILTTRASDNTGVLNIYDLAGNMFERTLEYASASGNTCACRGGIYVTKGSGTPASFRGYDGTIYSGSNTGFRPSLY